MNKLIALATLIAIALPANAATFLPKRCDNAGIGNNEEVILNLTYHTLEIQYDPDNPGQTNLIIDDIVALGYSYDYAVFIVTELIPDLELHAATKKEVCRVITQPRIAD